MNVVKYLNVNGIMKSETKMARRFILPDKTNVTRSLRFGAHAFALKETLQILPVGNYDRVPVFKNESDTQAKKLIKTIFKGCNLRSLLM